MRRLLGIVDRANYRDYTVQDGQARADVLALAVLTCIGINRRRRDTRLYRIQRFRRRCIVSNRARGVFGLFRVSAMTFKGLVADGRLPGMRKVGW